MAYTFLWFLVWIIQKFFAHSKEFNLDQNQKEHFYNEVGLFFYNFVELSLELGLYACILSIVCDLRNSLNAINKSTRSVTDISSEEKSNIQQNIKKIKIFFFIIFFTMIVGSCVQTLQPWLFTG